MNSSAPATHAAAETGAPIFTREGGPWLPDDYAAGPFRGLYGGAVAGLVAGAMEEHAVSEGWGTPLSATVLMLRPAPVAPLVTEITTLQAGRRNAVAECLLKDEAGKIISKGHAIFVKPDAMPGTRPLTAIPTATNWAGDPATLPLWANGKRPEHVNFLHILEMREERDATGKPGMRWSRMTRPLLPFASLLATLFTAADNASAFWLSGSGAWPTNFGFPNVDVSVHVSRAPQGEWIGVTPDAQLHETGMGMSEGALYDRTGLVGRTCQTNILVPRG